ncbi:uncharacterized protein FSUBG_2133 [Fusarium subglutinans]|uniref:Prion-inhibition and propagation HeLo domain-containing protein n=1 Tax=Gibberella subglutinans TaxID=42677 RepID=A0A8H5Q9J5_GIBSU|nr:uncharacterized protein FSUBG_2133 [Fusarium subglutinans]KAF5611696.1 hypothetical protein FSUBG_2133 [Fusarium subglutinans]
MLPSGKGIQCALEVAGLTIGAVALVNLFKDCVDLFSMIKAARDMGKYAAILDTKLDVEKMLFLQWSDRVGLLKQDSPNANAVLYNPDTRHIVSRALESVKALLSEGQVLQRDYGLKRAGESAEPTTGYQGASSFRFRKFLKQFGELKFKPDTDRHSNFKVTKQSRWVIFDKEKIKSLIDHLSYFNTSRIVYGMLLQPDISNRLFKDLQRESFNDYAVLSEIWCRMATTTPSDSDDIFLNALYPLVFGNSRGCTPAVTLHLLSRLQFTFGEHDEKCRRYCNNFSLALTLAIEMGMDNVVRPHIASRLPVYAASKEFQSPI